MRLSATRAARFAASRLVMQLIADSAAWGIALVFGTLVRFDLHLDRIPRRGLAVAILIALAVQGLSGLAFGLYTRRWRVGSFDEAAAVARTVVVTTAIVFFADVVVGRPAHLVPVSAVLGGGAAALVLIASVRYLWRHLVEAGNRPSAAAERLLIFGAGEGGAQVITQMLRDPDSPFVPVAVLDDAHDKRHLRIRGVPVVGTRGDLSAAGKKFVADHNEEHIPIGWWKREDRYAERLAPGTKFADIIGEIDPAKLMGGLSMSAEEALHFGRLVPREAPHMRVLVTGAGGSIGSELCRQIYRFAPAELIMVDRDESGLHAVQLSIEGRALLESRDLVLLDIRDRAALEAVFTERRPQVVFHAAALKHLPLLERHPREAVRTNVLGTLTMLEVSSASGVDRFVNISSDKAAGPCSVRPSG